MLRADRPGPVVNKNTYGTPQEMMERVEYMTSDAISPMANLRRQNGREQPWRVAYLGIANEPWACGGSMRPEYYADEFRRYNTFVKNYARRKPIFRIAAGANAEDYRWTEVAFDGATLEGDTLEVRLPAKSVVVLALR